MDVKLPHLGEGADSGTVVNLFIKEGDQITVDQPLLELENEKAVATIPSTVSGTVTKVFVKVGQKISVGESIASVTGGAAPAKAKAEGAKEKPPSQKAEAGHAEVDHEEAQPDEETPQGPGPKDGTLPAASPTIRKIARDLGLDLSRVRGTARGGRVVMADLREYIQRLQKVSAQPGQTGGGSGKPAPEKIDFSKWGPVSKKALTPLRQVIARRMLENWTAIPHVTQFDEADLTRLIAVRKKHVKDYEKQDARLTVTALLLKSVVDTLKKHPHFNASLDEAAQEIVLKEYYHFGIAVDTEAGLIVPVLRDVDKKNMLELSKELESLAAKARDRKVTSEELQGGTFTISNQGGIGGGQFTPIINKPEVAILGLGRASLKAVVRDGKIEARMMLPLALSYDHRVLDGGQAARFMVDLVQGIEGMGEEGIATGR